MQTYLAVNDLTLMLKECQIEGLVWTKYESYILHAESLRLVWTKYESYILHTSAVMYTFQNLSTAVNDKV